MAANNAPNGPAFIQANQHSSQVLRQLIQSIFATAGIVNAGDLAVTANGTPNMSVNVASGFAVLPGTQVTNTQGNYHVYNDATVNLSIAAANATNPRIDIVVASIQDQAYSGTNNQWILQVITGTPAPSPSVPATPVNSIVLAQVAVAANALSIVAGNITDKRVNVRRVPSVSVYRAGAGSTPAGSVWTTMIFDTVVRDTASAYATGSGIYTIPAGFAGLWRFRAELKVSNLANATRISIGIAQNTNNPRFVGSDVQSTGIAGYVAVTVECELDCAVGDTVYATALNSMPSTAATWQLDGPGQTGYMQGSYLGPSR